jgi:type IV secretion system protein VirB10
MADTANSRAEPRKVDPETLVLRANPRSVVRFKRGLLIGIAAVACLAVFGATWLALGEGRLASQQSDGDLYSIDRKRTPDELAALPSSYDRVKPLGAPLPGDLGPSVVDREKSLGVPAADASLRPNPDADAERAEHMRLAQQARQAREAGVFFQTSNAGHGLDTTALQSNAAGDGGTSPVGFTTVSESSDSRLNLDPTRDQNAQQRKLDFLNGKPEKDIYDPHALQQPVSPYEVLAGSIISASLITGLNSDLPGLVVAQVTENVFDSVKGQTLLIPQGSRLIGSYDSVVAFHQSRALVVWQRIIMPDGSSIQIDNLPAMDSAGYSGLKDDVDYHTWALLEGVGLSTLLGVSTQLTLNGQSSLVTAIRQSTQDSVNQAGQQITEKNLNIQPTITVRPGWPLRVIVHKDLVLRPYRG